MVRNITKEEGCFEVSYERKFYHRGNVIIKRTLKPREYGEGANGPHVPRLSQERLKNEIAAMKFIRAKSSIPVPAVYAHFEDDGAYYMIMEYVPGKAMCDLKEADKLKVYPELERIQDMLKDLKSDRIGGASGLLIPPYRVLRRTERNDWKPHPPQQGSIFTFCHNDLTQSNIIVDPQTYQIKGVIDWEYSGFYPESFEIPFYKRLGPSAAINNERDDSYEMLHFLEANCTSASS